MKRVYYLLVAEKAPLPENPWMAISTVDECLAHLHRARWSIGDIAVLYPGGWTWIVSGTKGDHRIIAKGRSESEAWEQARRLAESVDCAE